MLLAKKCVVCGKRMKVEIDDKTRVILTKGIFYTKMKLPDKGAKIIKEWEEDLFDDGKKIKVVEYDKYKEVEYWECPRCCADEIITEETGINLYLFKQWIKKNFGKRCRDYVKGCPVCDAYVLYAHLKEMLDIQYDDEHCTELVEEQRKDEEKDGDDAGAGDDDDDEQQK